MHLPQITDQLDRFFRIDTLPPDMPFSKLVPQVYAGTPIDLKAHLEPAFLQRFHGLMVNNGPVVDRIYTLVFLSDEILDKVLAGGERNLLLFSHHPLVMETRDRGSAVAKRPSLTRPSLTTRSSPASSKRSPGCILSRALPRRPSARTKRARPRPRPCKPPGKRRRPACKHWRKSFRPSSMDHRGGER